MTRVKICGLASEEAVRAAATAGADFAGFVHFPPSPRHLAPAMAKALRALLPETIAAVSVMVDPNDALLEEVAALAAPDYFQLHGRETPDRLREIHRKFPRIKLIKAVPIRSGDDVAHAMRYLDCADMLMFDAKPPAAGMPGGNGLSFDWALLKGRDFPLPWFLSGGLNPDNIAEAIASSGTSMVDVSSGVESAPGVKDAALIEAFIKAAKSA